MINHRLRAPAGRHRAPLVASSGETTQQREETLALGGVERRQRRFADPDAARYHGDDQRLAGGGKAQRRAAPVLGIARALDQLPLLEPLDDTLDRRRIHRREAAKPVLRYLAEIVQLDEGGVLRRGHRESVAELC